MAGRDTKTRYQSVYARHQEGCLLSVAWATEKEKLDPKLCDCAPSYFGVAWDKKAGKPRKTGFRSKAVEARNERADLHAALRAGRPASTSRTTIREAVDEFKEAIEDGKALNKHGRPYRDDAARDLTSTLGHFPEDWYRLSLDALDGARVQAAIDDWIDEVGGSRIRARVSALRSLYSWARLRGKTTADPAATDEVRLPAVNSKPRDRVADPVEYGRLLAALADDDQVPLALAAYGSPRAGEVRRLDWTDIDFDKRLMLLAGEGGKSEAATRVVPIVKPLLAILRAAYLRQGRPKSGTVCRPRRASKSQMLATGQYLKRCRKAWKAANAAEKKAAREEGRKPLHLAPINLQEARHTFATWLDHAGVSPKVASEWIGHSTPERQRGAAPITLNRYTHMLDGELERAAVQVEAFLAQRLAEGAATVG